MLAILNFLLPKKFTQKLEYHCITFNSISICKKQVCKGLSKAEQEEWNEKNFTLQQQNVK